MISIQKQLRKSTVIRGKTKTTAAATRDATATHLLY